MTQQDPSRIPVIVGVGTVDDRADDGGTAMDSAQLMVAALTAAAGDAGDGWLARCDRILVVPQLSFAEIDVSGALAAATHLDPSAIREAPVPSGDTPIRLLNDAANAIAAGEVRTCAVVGGEAMRTAMRAGKPLFPNAARNASELCRRYGLVMPADIYPLYENASRAAAGQTLAEGQQETGLIWSLMAEVAADNEAAWLRSRRTAAEIVEPTSSNRPIAFPFTKLMVANASVNQGAATIVTSLAEARRCGVSDDRLIYVGAGAAAHEADDAMARAAWTTPIAMQVAIEEALSRNAVSVADLDHVELYSCFPCVPKMARRVLGWPADRPATVHGGLTFGGGPVANYMGHGIAAMVRRLRTDGRIGLLYGNGGYCSHNHCIVLSRDAPTAAFPQAYDVQALADARRGAIPRLTDAIEGDLPVETYTVFYGRDGAPSHGVVLSRGPDHERIIAAVDATDARAIAFLTDGTVEPVGSLGHNRRSGERLMWTPA